MKKLYFPLFLLSLGFILLYTACRKEVLHGDMTNEKELSVKDVKMFIEQGEGGQKNGILSLFSKPAGGISVKSIDEINAIVLWDRAKSFEKESFQMVEVPMVINEGTVVAYRTERDKGTDDPSLRVSNSFTRLLVFRNGLNGTLQKRIVTYIPDVTYLKKGRCDASKNWVNKLESDFSGYIEYRDWNMSVLQVYRMNGGRVDGKFRIRSQEKGAKKVNGAVAMGTVCDTQCWTKYKQQCIGVGPLEGWGGGGTGSGENCTWVEDGVQCTTYCWWEDDSNPNPDPNPGQVGSTTNAPSTAAVMNAIANKPFALFDSVNCALLKNWLALAQHSVDESIIDKLGTIGTTSSRIAAVQSINNAYSTVVNMDYFSVTVNNFPTVNGQQLTAAELHRYIRTHLNDFTDGADFTPYNANGVDDFALWNSTNPKGALVGIDMPSFDNGTVITSFSSSNRWTFTTVYEPMYGEHPVSGHRDFGFVENGIGGFTFYTKGVDRLTTWDASAAQWMTGIPFNAADDLWISFQDKIKLFVDTNGGTSTVNTPIILRPNWSLVKDVIDGKQPLSKLSKDCPN